MTEAAAPSEPTALTRHIEERYHARHREQLPQLVAMAERVEDGAGKLGELVEEKDAIVGKADLARFCPLSAPHDGRHRRRMMGLAEGTRARDAALAQQPRERMDHRGFQRLGRRKGRQYPRKPCRQHRLARTGRSHHQDVVDVKTHTQYPLG